MGVNPSLAAGVVGPEVLAGTTPADYDRRLEWVRNAAGERFADLELQCLTFLVQIVPDRDKAVVVGLPLRCRLPASTSREPRSRSSAPSTRSLDTLRARRERFGFSYIVVHEAEMEAFAPVVAELTGT